MACLLWILGFELLPNVHVGMHELFGHHHHEGGVDHAARAHDGDHGHGHGHGPRHTEHADDHAHADDHVHIHDRVDERAHAHHGEVDEHVHAHHAEHEPETQPEPEPEPQPETEIAIAIAPIVAPADDIAACESSRDHGRHSLAHRGVAVTQPPWVLAPVASAPVRVLPRVDTSTAQPPSRPLPRARARGPPVLT